LADSSQEHVENRETVPTTGWSDPQEVAGQEGTTMKYLILIHHNRGAREQFASSTPTMQAEGLAAYQKLNADLAASGEYVAGEALDADTTATIVRGDHGSFVQTDGPFAETKEMLAGFYLVDVASRERAVAIAQRIPEVAAGAAAIEVRPVMTYDWPEQ
jgi:hypothetical protein